MTIFLKCDRNGFWFTKSQGLCTAVDKVPRKGWWTQEDENNIKSISNIFNASCVISINPHNYNVVMLGGFSPFSKRLFFNDLAF